MQVVSLAWVLGLLLAALGRAEEQLTVELGSASPGGEVGAPSPTRVIEVTAARYDKLLRKEPLALLEVYSPGCYHCQQLEPAYAHAASVLVNEAVPIPLARINVDTEKEFVDQKFPNIEGTPMLVVLREGREVERLKYGGQGALEGEKIITAMRELALAPHGSNEVKELSELSDLRVGKGLQGAIVVSKPIGEAMVVAVLESPPVTKAQGESAEDSGVKEDAAVDPVAALFGSVTRTMKQKIGFAHTYTDGLRADLKVKKPNMLLLLEAPYLTAASARDNSLLASLDLDELVQRHITGESVDLRAATEAAKEWILQNAKPPVGILTQRSFGSLYRLHRPLLVAFVEGDMHEPESSTTDFTERARKHFTMLRKLVRDDTWKEDGLE
jgi:thiol-disulfide isomerase/thioredoxin